MWRRIVVGVVLAAAGFGFIRLVGGDDDAPGSIPDDPSFGTLEELAASSDLVVVGTVRVLRSGETQATGARTVQTVVQVHDVLRGEYTETLLAVTTLESAYSDQPTVRDWRLPGNRVVAFLVAGEDGATGSGGEPLYLPVSHRQSFYFLEGDDLTAAYQDPGVLGEQIAAMTLSELVSALARD